MVNVNALAIWRTVHEYDTISDTENNYFMVEQKTINHIVLRNLKTNAKLSLDRDDFINSSFSQINLYSERSF